MKFVVTVLFGALLAIVVAEQYTTKYDNVDLDQILRSDRLLKNYLNCFLDKGKCTPDGAEVRKNLPDALESECSKCSEKQKEGAKKILHFLIENKRDAYDELAAKYDPEGKYLKKYEELAKKENLNI